MTVQNKNKKEKNKTFLYYCNIALAVVVVVGIFSKLVLVNDVAQQQFLISQHMHEAEVLAEETQQLSVVAAELSSTDRLIQESTRLQLVKVDHIRYLESPSVVALRD